MTDHPQQPESESEPETATDPESEIDSEGTDDDQGPGCMPAILAATALMGMVGFVVCAFSTWLLFQKRTELAVRTLRGAYIAEIEQSLLDPQTKSAVVREIETLAEDLEGGKYENWQAAGIMQRLQRLPVIQWGELQAIEAYLQRQAEADSGDDVVQALKQISRLKRAVDLGTVTSFDFQDVLEPVRRADESTGGFRLVQPLKRKQVDEVIHRAKLLADRAEVPDQGFEEAKIEVIVRREIERGATEGSY